MSQALERAGADRVPYAPREARYPDVFGAGGHQQAQREHWPATTAEVFPYR